MTSRDTGTISVDEDALKRHWSSPAFSPATEYSAYTVQEHSPGESIFKT